MSRPKNTASPDFDELDIVRLVTDAYKRSGLKRGAQGTIVHVHRGGDAYEVEMSKWMEDPLLQVKTLEKHEIEMVKKWRG